MRLSTSLAALLLTCSTGCLSPLRCDAGDDEPRDLASRTADMDKPVGAACGTTAGGCNAGLSCCTGRCVDPTLDPLNCGGCGIGCDSGSCLDGFCTCDTDAGVPGCGYAGAPTCGATGQCSCGGSVCAAPRTDRCVNDQCVCGSGGACGANADHCDPAQSPSCRCGAEPACDTTRSSSCNPSQTPSCRCGGGPACSAGSSCCDIAGTCCPSNKYCCLDGCCDHPCLLFGACG